MNIKGFIKDNARDFNNKEISDFCINERIWHKTSCPYTPQQNGLVERKIRDIMDKGKTLITYSSLPKNLWGLAIMTAVCLINRLPSKTLGLQSPVKGMENCFPTIRLRNGLSPKVFGYLCYIHIHKYGDHQILCYGCERSICGILHYTKGLSLLWPDIYYVAYKPITLSCILFMFIEMIFTHCHSCEMFVMNSMSMCND